MTATTKLSQGFLLRTAQTYPLMNDSRSKKSITRYRRLDLEMLGSHLDKE